MPPGLCFIGALNTFAVALSVSVVSSYAFPGCSGFECQSTLVSVEMPANASTAGLAASTLLGLEVILLRTLLKGARSLAFRPFPSTLPAV